MISRIIVALLAGFYPATFFLSNNWHVFSFQQNFILLIGTSIISLIGIFAVSYFIDRLIQLLIKHVFYTNNNGSNKSDFTFIHPLLTICSLSVCIYLLRNTLESINVPKILLYFIVADIAILFVLNAHKKGIKLLCNFFIILTVLSILSLITNVYKNTKVPIEDWTFKNKDIYDQITFTKKPNVYLIIAESYSSKPALEAVYNIDNSLFYEKLGELGLKMNHDYFSNYNHTLSSLPSLFSMEHHFGIINLGNYDSLGGRRMIEGKIYNPVIDVFRANNYKIQYLHDVSGLIPNGASVDFCIPSPTFLHGLEIFLTDQNLIESTNNTSNKSKPIVSIKNQIANSSFIDRSYFNFIYLSLPGHSPSRLKASSKKAMNQKLGEFRNSYSKKIEMANKELIDLLEFIINKDHDSIITIIGDHGSWGFRFKEDSQGNKISNQLYILDRFGVLAGIRAPDILSSLIENNTIKSHVNLFKYIFAYLGEDDKVLKTRAPDDSYEVAYLMAIKNGEILQNPIRVGIRP